VSRVVFAVGRSEVSGLVTVRLSVLPAATVEGTLSTALSLAESFRVLSARGPGARRATGVTASVHGVRIVAHRSGMNAFAGVESA
jgi:hypothetical protein